jgi:hypothetical protein
MSKFLYSEIKPALNSFDASEWVDADSQQVDGITVGIMHPASANWAYTVQVEILNHTEHGKVLAETVRQFGSLVGVVTYQQLSYLIG